MTVPRRYAKFMKLILILSLLISSVSHIYAGNLYEITLTKNGKDKVQNVHIGETFTGTAIIGYSPKLEKFLSIYFEDGEKEIKPIFEYWNSTIGKQVKLYKFKESGETLMSIDDPWDIKSLPQVDKISVKNKGHID